MTMPHIFYSERNNEYDFGNFLFFPLTGYYLYLNYKRLKNELQHYIKSWLCSGERASYRLALGTTKDENP